MGGSPRRLPRLRRLRQPERLHEVAGRHLADPRLRAVLGSYAATVGETLTDGPAGLTVLPYLEQTFGLWTVDGGLHRLVDALRRRAEERGTRLRFGTPVERILLEGRVVTGVALAGGEVVPADVVVAAVHPALLRDLLPRARQRPDVADDGRSVLGMALRVDDPASEGRTVVPEGRTVVIPADPSQPSVSVNRSGAALTLHTGCAPADTAQVPRDHSAALMTTLAEAGFDLGEVTVVAMRTPADLERHTGAPGGRVYGPSGRGPAAIVQRPANRTGVRGLFLAGAGAHPGPGLPMVGISASIVADLVGRA